jgi:hypothetical protein
MGSIDRSGTAAQYDIASRAARGVIIGCHCVYSALDAVVVHA